MRARIGELASSRWERCHGDRQSRAKSRESGEIRNLKTVRGALRINDRSIQAEGIARTIVTKQRKAWYKEAMRTDSCR